jgi:hypothetical protein
VSGYSVHAFWKRLISLVFFLFVLFCCGKKKSEAILFNGLLNETF